MLKKYRKEKKKKNELKKGNTKKEKRALLKKKVCTNKNVSKSDSNLSIMSFRFRVANHFTTDTHKSFACLSIDISPMNLLIRLQIVSPLKSHTCLD